MNGDRLIDEDAIRKLVDRQMQAWAAGDPEAYASVFTSDADYVTFLGSHYQGRTAIAASYVPLFKKLLKGSRLDIEITQLRFLTPDVALILADAAVHRARRRKRREARGCSRCRVSRRIFRSCRCRDDCSRSGLSDQSAEAAFAPAVLGNGAFER